MADVQKGDEVSYRSLAGPVYDAVVTGVRPSGFVDLAVDVGAKEPYPLIGVRADRIESKGKATLHLAAPPARAIWFICGEIREHSVHKKPIALAAKGWRGGRL